MTNDKLAIGRPVKYRYEDYSYDKLLTEEEYVIFVLTKTSGKERGDLLGIGRWHYYGELAKENANNWYKYFKKFAIKDKNAYGVLNSIYTDMLR